MAGRSGQPSGLRARSNWRDGLIIVIDRFRANGIALALAGAVLAGFIYYNFLAHRMPYIAREIEHDGTLVRFTQVQWQKGQGYLVYFLKLEDGRIVTISSRHNHFVQVGTKVPVIESKTVNGGTLFKFKDS